VVKSFPIELFVKDNSGQFKGVLGENLSKIEFDDIQEAMSFIKEYRDVQDIYGQTDMLYQFLAHEYPDEIEFDFKKISVLAFDIETAYDSSRISNTRKS
jgi:hypothetical protein